MFIVIIIAIIIIEIAVIGENHNWMLLNIGKVSTVILLLVYFFNG